MTSVKVFRIREQDRKSVAGFEQVPVGELDPGEVVVKVAYSGINYKDALAATGAGKVVRRFPCVGGIDLAGTVLSSSDPRFKTGDQVIATSFDLGVAHDGGYAEIARVPADWVVPLPAGLSLLESMALGTAGYTAGLAILQMEHNGLKPGRGPVVVTGATGGVGSLAVDMLSTLGHEVVAVTGKETEAAFLTELGASEVRLRQSIDLGKIRPLDKALWAGAVDNLGGDMLAWIASTMKDEGTIASIGLAASMSLNTTVAPFILRGAKLLGINSVTTPMPIRRRVWDRLAADLKPRHLDRITRVIGFDELPGAFDAFLKSQVRGRIVVSIAKP
jgi:acrylyl-CoA reductase (NADPH)